MPASNLHCNWFYIISIVGLNVTALRTKGNILTDLWPMWVLGAALLSIDKKLGKQLAAWRGRTSSPPHHSTSARLSPAVIRQILVDIMWVDTRMCLVYAGKCWLELLNLYFKWIVQAEWMGMWGGTQCMYSGHLSCLLPCAWGIWFCTFIYKTIMMQG